MKFFSKKRLFMISGVGISTLVTLVFFQNCSKASFTSSGSGSSGLASGFSRSSNEVSTQVTPENVNNTSQNQTSLEPVREPASTTLQEEDIITPRLVFSATPNGPAQKDFKPGQKIYARGYGLSDNLENLEFHYTIVGSQACYGYGCIWSRDSEKAKEIKKTFKYNPKNRTWNFEFSLAFEQARKVVIKDKTQIDLDDTGFKSELTIIQNNAIARSTPDEAKIIAVTELNSSLKNSTYGIVPEGSLDFYTAYKYYVVGAKSNNIVYCAEVTGSNICSDKNKWQKANPDRYNSILLRQEITDIAYFYGNDGHYLYDFSYRCGSLVGSRAHGKTVTYYAEELTSGTKAVGTFTYGPMYDCGEYNPGSGKASFGPG